MISFWLAFYFCAIASSIGVFASPRDSFFLFFYFSFVYSVFIFARDANMSDSDELKNGASEYEKGTRDAISFWLCHFCGLLLLTCFCWILLQI